jgi:hypothetical protein
LLTSLFVSLAAWGSVQFEFAPIDDPSTNFNFERKKK